MIDLPLFQLATRLNSQNTKETEINNEFWNINLFTNIVISNYYIWSFGPTKMIILTLFQFLTRLLNSKHLKPINTYLMRRNGEMWKMFFSAPQNAKRKICWNMKTKFRIDFLSTVRSSSMKDYTCHYGVSNKRQMFTLILIKIENLEIFFYT